MKLHDENKLPKWAQRELFHLRARRQEAVDCLDALTTHLASWSANVLTTGDHHNGPEYEHCVLLPAGVDIDVLCEEFRTTYPFRCPEHDYDSDGDHSCEECYVFGLVAEDNLFKHGIKRCELGFWNVPFADWLARNKGGIKVELNECAVAYG